MTPDADADADADAGIDIDAILDRSYQRVLTRLDATAPCRDGDTIRCPFCDRAMEVRKTVLGSLNRRPETLERPHIDGVHLKCAGDDGCAFNAGFDVPLVTGYWPDLSHEAEFERELDRRDGERRIDHAYSRAESQQIEAKLEALGYL